MSNNLISPRRHVDRVAFSLVCEFTGPDGKVIERGHGFRFDCDENGNLSPETHPAGRANYERIKSGEIRTNGLTIERREYVEHIPAVCRCECGRKVTLWDGWSNECDCGREFNGSGQLLAPRSQWGEETGEQF